MQTAISPDKIDAYRTTHYRVGDGPKAFTLRIDIPSHQLRRLYESTGHACGVFITAFNPFGQQLSANENEAAQSPRAARSWSFRSSLWILCSGDRTRTDRPVSRLARWLETS
jgi:hypothetical protein